ncbi:MAG: RHS repeat protein [Chloroflexi bacterium]|nr:RHS repeat protein [Anaerolineae bacterium]MBL1173135.1 RHS repeat protein [Chloroflexota bacterium]NOG76632.1 RHS repeat protein [Chloroflexota bacterium]
MPSLNVSYQNSPFKVTLTQAIDTGLTFTVVRNYDGMGRQTSTVTNGVTTASTFDACGKPLTQSMPHTTGAWYYTTTEYDSMGRAISVTAPDGTSTSYAYNGLTTTVTDANNHSTTTVTNILGQTLSVTPPTGPNVAFTYDPLGNLLTATRGGASTALTYDKAGRKTNMVDADMGTWNYSYDALGNMVTQTDARGCATTIQYDVLNRPTNKSYSNCPSGVSATASVTYTYDVGANGKGRRTSMNDDPGSASWQYDSRGRVIKETKTISGNSFVTEWGYNLADLPTWMKYPDGEIVNTAYDNRMMAVSVTGNDSYVLDIQYDSAGRMTSRALGNGLTQTYTYYPWNQQGGRLKIIAAGSLQNMTYAYDSTGNISTITDSINSLTQSFDYDALDRLTSASASGTQAQGAYSEIYQYDPATGNLKIKGDLTLNYADADHKHAVTSANGNAYSYDSNGNQTTRHIGSDIFYLIYDVENRLVEVKKNNVAISQFTYDGDGKRVMFVIGGETVRFVGGYYERKGSEITKYYMAGALRVAMRKVTSQAGVMRRGGRKA